MQLSTGKSEHADLLIGADGSHSRVRHLMLGDSELAFRFLGFHTAAFVFEDRSFAESLEGKRYDCAGQVRLRRWTFGRVALVGDACQCTSPLAGQGASLAMHGAYVLADELVRAKSLDDALARYERAVKPQAERKQSMGRRVAPWLVPATGWRLSMRNVLIRLANARSTGWMLRPMLASG